jgi:hypothetical protein
MSLITSDARAVVSLCSAIDDEQRGSGHERHDRQKGREEFEKSIAIVLLQKVTLGSRVALCEEDAAEVQGERRTRSVRPPGRLYASRVPPRRACGPTDSDADRTTDGRRYHQRVTFQPEAQDDANDLFAFAIALGPVASASAQQFLLVEITKTEIRTELGPAKAPYTTGGLVVPARPSTPGVTPTVAEFGIRAWTEGDGLRVVVFVVQAPERQQQIESVFVVWISPSKSPPPRSSMLGGSP